jgi:hypothetical protein
MRSGGDWDFEADFADGRNKNLVVGKWIVPYVLITENVASPVWSEFQNIIWITGKASGTQTLAYTI